MVGGGRRRGEWSEVERRGGAEEGRGQSLLGPSGSEGGAHARAVGDPEKLPWVASDG
jgi:hypothetical protein